jgi:hypothetical protein
VTGLLAGTLDKQMHQASWIAAIIDYAIGAGSARPPVMVGQPDTLGREFFGPNCFGHQQIVSFCTGLLCRILGPIYARRQTRPSVVESAKISDCSFRELEQ